jgi:CheY-like chemotaxis protein
MRRLTAVALALGVNRLQGQQRKDAVGQLPGRRGCIAVSADAMPSHINRVNTMGFEDYWTKPLDLSDY